MENLTEQHNIVTFVSGLQHIQLAIKNSYTIIRFHISILTILMLIYHSQLVRKKVRCGQFLGYIKEKE